MKERTEPVFLVQVKPPGSKLGERVDVSEKVISIDYDDAEGKADKFVIALNNWDLAVFDDPTWRKGTVLIVSWGYVGNMAPSREVVVQKMTGFQVLKIEALAKSVLMHKTTKSRHFDAIRRSDVARMIAQENGYGPAEQDIEDTNVVLPTLTQGSISDATFLMRLAHQEGFEFYVDFDGFHFHQKRLTQRPIRVLTWYNDPGAGDIISVNVDSDVAAKPGAVALSGRDPLSKQDIKTEANNEVTHRPALGPVPEASVDPVTGSLTFSTNNVSTESRSTTEVNKAAASREAEGSFRRAQNVAVKMKITIVGDPRLPAKTVIEVRGLGKRLSGKYYVKSHAHKIDQNGYLSTLTLVTNGSQGTKTDKATKTAADVNKKQAETDGGKLSQSLVVDPETGTKTLYRDTAGRASRGAD